MGFIRRKRIFQVIKFGWKDAKEIAALKDVKESRFSLFIDILSCFKKYYLFSNQYKNKEIWKLSEQERISLAETIGNQNKKRDHWVDTYYDDWKFLNKYTSLSWMESPQKIKKRNEAYRIHYGLGENVWIQYGVTFICEHFSVGKITCGKNVVFARNVDIDYTGDLTIGDNVSFSEGVKVLTHIHDFYHSEKDGTKGCVLTPLVIQNMATFGSRAIIMPGVGEIGRGAVISSFSYVRNKVPPYAIVMGNPAKIIGFRFPPEEIVKFEEEHYPPEQRIPLEILQKNYDKYYKSQWKEINNWVRSLSVSSNNK